MKSLRQFTQVVVLLSGLLMMASVAFAADPGLPFPDTSEGSDDKGGSVLFYNIYTSNPAAPAAQNTRFNITNTNGARPIAVHLYFVDGNSCSVSDRYICLTENQTMTFLASDQDPAVTGYLVAVASDFRGHPERFNFLVGDLFVKFSTGHFANLGAEAYSKLTNANVLSTDGTLAALFFDGLLLAGSYNRISRVVAIDNIPARADGNSTALILNRVGGNLGTTAASLGPLFGILYDDAETPHSFNLFGGCQLIGILNNVGPRTTPRFEVVIPAGQTGWLKIFSNSDIGIIGAVINFNPNAAASAGSFNSGHNLHKLRLTAAANLVIPIFEPHCGFVPILTTGGGE